MGRPAPRLYALSTGSSAWKTALRPLMIMYECAPSKSEQMTPRRLLPSGCRLLRSPHTFAPFAPLNHAPAAWLRICVAFDLNYLQVARAVSVLGRDGFVNTSSFLLVVLRNIVQNSTNVLYRKVRSSHPGVHHALQDPTVRDMMRAIGFLPGGEGSEYWHLPGALSDHELQTMKQTMESLVAARKRLHVLEGWEIFASDLQWGPRLGHGSFGDVFLCRYQGREVGVGASTDSPGCHHGHCAASSRGGIHSL